MPKAQKSGKSGSGVSLVCDELRSLAGRARAASAGFGTFVSSNAKLVTVAGTIGKSWAKGYFGYHARTYLDGFRAAGPNDYFDTTWGHDFQVGETRGDWREYDSEEVMQVIQKKAGSPDLKEMDRVAQVIGDVFTQVRNDVTPILAALRSDVFFEKVGSTIEGLSQYISPLQAFKVLAPQRFSTNDRQALQEGIQIPPHMEVQAQCMSRASYASSCANLAAEIERAVKYMTTKSTLLDARQEKMSETRDGDPGVVFVIHGRNTKLLEELSVWLDSIGLHARGFDLIRAELGGSPTIMEVIQKGMTEARAIIALMTPDEVSFLRPGLQSDHDSAPDKQRWQARPNVIFEAGMAFALAGKDRTLILVAGVAELFSDVGGINYKRLPHDSTEREILKNVLRSMKCNVRDNDPTHHKRGDFKVDELTKLPTRNPFELE